MPVTPLIRNGQPSRSSLNSISQAWAVDHPVAGVATMTGLIFAVLMLPIDVETEGALQLPAAILLLSLSLVPVLGVLRNPKLLFRAEHVLILSPVYWLLLDPLQGRGNLNGMQQEHVQRAFVAITVFVFGAWIAFLQRPWRAPRLVQLAARTELPTRVCFGIGLIAFGLAFLKYAVPAGFDIGEMWQALQGNRWTGPWQRGNLGGAEAFLDHLSYFAYLLPPLVVLLAKRVGWADRRPIILALCALVHSAFVLQGGGRRLVGLFLGSGIVFWFLATRRVRPLTIVTLVVALGGVGYTLDHVLSYRNSGVIAAFVSDDASPEYDAAAGLVRVDDNFLRLVQMTAIFPEQHPYTTWRYALWVAVRPVPRLFWPTKPLDPGFDFSEAVGVKGASLSASVIGELFMAGGFLAVILGGWLYGRLARSLSHFLEQGRTSGALLIYSIGLFALFIGMRSMIELVLTSYIILAWIGLVDLYQGFRQ